MRSYSFKSRIAAGVGLILALVFAAWVWAGYTTSAGSVTISVDTTSASGGTGTWTTLPDMFFEEAYSNDVGGAITMTLPAGYEFNTAAGVGTATLIQGHNNASKNINSTAVGGNFTLNRTATTLRIPVTSLSETGNNPNLIRWRGVQVRPTGTAPLAAANIMLTVVAPLHPTTDGIMATLTLVHGAMTKLQTVLPGQTFTAGSGVTGTPTARTAGTPFVVTQLVATDRFNNVVTSYTGSKAVTWSGPTATCSNANSYTTPVNFSSGQSSTILNTTIFAAGSFTLTAASDGFSTPSSSFTVNPLAASKLVIALPGQSFTSCVGATGTVTGQSVDTAFSVLISATDTYNNLITSYTGSKTLTWSGPSGTTNTYASPVTFSAGQAGSVPVTIGTGQTTTLSVNDGSIGGPASDSVVVTGGATTAAAFNAFDTSTAAGLATGRIQTKIAGANFSVDLVALASDGTVASGFTGAVKVELVNSSVTTDTCASWPAIVTHTNQNFTGASPSRITMQPLKPTNAYKNVRIRITNEAVSPATVSCSNDNFAIRPARYEPVLVTDNDAVTQGTARSLSSVSLASSAPTHRAGHRFTISATAVGSDGAVLGNYSGSPVTTTAQCTSGTAACPATLGTLTVLTWNANAGVISATAAYSDVGSFNLSLEDRTFADVDVGDTVAADRYFSSAAPATAGRFVPSYFSVATGAISHRVTPGCTGAAASTFTYLGEAFRVSYTVTAHTAAGGITANYAGGLAMLDPGNPSHVNVGAINSATTSTPLMAPITAITQANPGRVTTGQKHGLKTGAQVFLSGLSGMAALNNTLQTATVIDDTNFTIASTSGMGTFGGQGTASRVQQTAGAGAWAGGVLNGTVDLILHRNVSPEGPYANVQIGILPVDTDATTAPGAALNLNTDGDSPATSDRIKVTPSTGADLRFGRLALRPNYGIHQLSLRVPVALQYYNGTSFITNVADNCTALSTTNATLGSPLGALAATPTPVVSVTAVSATKLGAAYVTLSKPTPTPTGKGSILLTLNLSGLAYLQGNWTPGSTDYTFNPSARASFGDYGATPVIYVREVY